MFIWQIKTPRNSVLLLLFIDFKARMKRHRILCLAIYIAPQLCVVVAAWRLRRPDEKTSYNLLENNSSPQLRVVVAAWRFRRSDGKTPYIFFSYCKIIKKDQGNTIKSPLRCISYLPFLLSPWLLPAAT